MPAEARPLPQREAEVRAAQARLAADGLIVNDGSAWRTSRAWQRAMARAAARLFEEGDAGEDLRTPIALALVERYSADVEDEVLAQLVEAMLPIEAASLGFVQR